MRYVELSRQLQEKEEKKQASKQQLAMKTAMVVTTVCVLGVAVGIKLSDSRQDVSSEATEAAFETTVETNANQVASMTHLAGSQVYDSLAETSTEAVDHDVVATTETSEFDGKFIANITDTLNIRSAASTDAEIVGVLYPGCVGTILGTEGDWTQITSGEVTGYVMTEYILTGKDAEEKAEQYGKYEGTVEADIVNVRREADESSDAIAMFEKGDTVYVTDTLDGWYKVLFNENWEGYISSEYLSVEYKYGTAITMEEVLAKAEQAKEEEAAKQAELTAQSSGSSTTTAAGSGNETSVDTVTQTATAASYDDAYLLACLISMEAGYEPYEGQLAVANVVLNRLHSGYYGSTISDVIYAKGQFPCATGSVMNSYLANGPLPEAQQAANEALSGVNNIGSYTGFINVKYADYSSYSNYTIIGNHCFH